ncbi:hypothetical protein BASA81_017052 [Batrachochytrium salamandrivorans]|nr:hypothetical protein BASA81_017052 [Batrachochytrium salamandrivorans]
MDSNCTPFSVDDLSDDHELDLIQLQHGEVQEAVIQTTKRGKPISSIWNLFTDAIDAHQVSSGNNCICKHFPARDSTQTLITNYAAPKLTKEQLAILHETIAMHYFCTGTSFQRIEEQHLLKAFQVVNPSVTLPRDGMDRELRSQVEDLLFAFGPDESTERKEKIYNKYTKFRVSVLQERTADSFQVQNAQEGNQDRNAILGVGWKRLACVTTSSSASILNGMLNCSLGT